MLSKCSLSKINHFTQPHPSHVNQNVVLMNDPVSCKRYEHIGYFYYTTGSVYYSECRWVYSDKGVLRNVSVRQIHRIKKVAVKKPLMSSKQVSEAVGASGVPRTSWCRIPQGLDDVHKAVFQLPLTNAHKEKHFQWLRNMNIGQIDRILNSWWMATMSQQSCDFSKEVADWCSGLESWERPISCHGIERRNIPSWVKLFSYKTMHHPKNFMVWPPSFLDLNPIENLGRILKRKLFEGGQQVTSKQQLWEVILAATKEIQAETVHGLTSSMDERVVKVMSKRGYNQ